MTTAYDRILHPNFFIRWGNDDLYATRVHQRERILAALYDELRSKGYFWKIVRKDWYVVRPGTQVLEFVIV